MVKKSPEQRPATVVKGGVASTRTLIGPGHNHDRVLEADGIINVSQSKVKSWRNCRKQFYYKYVELLKKKKVKRPFTFGTIVHSMLEAFAEGDDPFEVLDKIELEKGAYFRREVEMYGNIIEDLRTIMRDYFDFWGEHSLIYIRKNKRSSEHEFRVEIESGLWFTGRIDGAGKARKMRWVVENKSFTRAPSEDERWRSVQAAVYFRAFEMMGWEQFDGVLWNYICSKPPTIPEMLKSGEWSQKKISTIPTRLREWAKENKVDLKKLPNLMESATENQSNYFFRVYNPVKFRVVDILFNDFLETAREIRDMFGKVQSRNIGRHCSWCDYEPLCRAELTGSDVEFLKSREYIVSEDGPDGEDTETD